MATKQPPSASVGGGFLFWDAGDMVTLSPALSHRGRWGPSTGSGRTGGWGLFCGLRTNRGVGVLRRVQDERGAPPTPKLFHRGRRGPSTGSGRTGVTLTPVSSTGQALTLSHRGRGGPSTGSERTEGGGTAGAEGFGRNMQLPRGASKGRDGLHLQQPWVVTGSSSYRMQGAERWVAFVQAADSTRH